MEANSPVARDNVWEWYVSVAKSRMHNGSRELLVMTRWNTDDLIGRLEAKEPFSEITSLDSLENSSGGSWAKLNFEAIKAGSKTLIDPREQGEALWERRHSAKLLAEKRNLDPKTFVSLYQGWPEESQGLLYGDNFKTYNSLPEDIIKSANYTDTADLGEDYLCSVCYQVDKCRNIYITDMVFTQQGMEVTEEAVAEMLIRNKTRIAYIESNNGGRGFARNVEKIARHTKIQWFHQSGNKEARILTNYTTVLKHVFMPEDWKQRWSEFYCNITKYKHVFKSNKFHDAPDVLTGIVEYEIVNNIDKTIKFVKMK